MFTASNGIQVWLEDGTASLSCGIPHEGATEALREFFLQERDEELGRWRWPENPDYVVYAGAGGLLSVVNEANGYHHTFFESKIQEETFYQPFRRAAQAYLEAHPEPQSWEKAKPGEVWVLTINGVDEAATAYPTYHGTGVLLHSTNGRGTYSPDDEEITDGRRIWPEPDDG